jgi:hypothetical protein
MEFAQAVREGLDLQMHIPDRRRPLEPRVRYLAEVFLLETPSGPAFVWLTPEWPGRPVAECAGICYACPAPDPSGERWVDNRPRHGAKCLDYLSPIVIERLRPDSPAWQEHVEWSARRGHPERTLSREAAWRVAEAFLEGLPYRRIL